MKTFLRIALVLCCTAFFGCAAFSQQPTSDTASQGPSYDDTVKWIKDNISLAGTLPSQVNAVGNHVLIKSNGKLYTLGLDGCKSLTLTMTLSGSITDLGDPTDASTNDATVVNVRYRIPLESILSVTWLNSNSNNQLSSFDVQTGAKYKLTGGIAIAVSNGVASVSQDTTDTAGSPTSNPPVPLTTKNVYPPTNVTTDATPEPIIIVEYAKPGSEDAPEHMTSAIRHLLDVCKSHPEQAPKSLF
jgi:hypothetical protein